MKTSVKVIIGLVVTLVLVGMPLMGSYNGLITKESDVDLAWSQVESQLQRRNDLIPNLVNSVKGSMQNEQEIFTAIANARAGISSADSTGESIEANNQMSSAVTKLLVSVENYPELKSNQNVVALMDELAGTENRIATERSRFNETVQSYNNKVKRFPGLIIARTMGFEQKPYFEAVDGADVAPEVEFN